MKPRILIVDDHKMFREALKYILGSDPDFEVVAEAGDGVEALARAGETRFDIVCMDINMPGMNGIETTRRVVAAQPGVKVIGLSAYSGKEYVLEMLDAGAVGYITKDEAGNELLRAIRTVMLGETYLCPDAAAAAADIVPANGSKAVFSSARLDSREQEILQLLAASCSFHEIAEQLRMKACLVDVYRRNIMRKLGVHSDVELSAYLKE